MSYRRSSSCCSVCCSQLQKSRQEGQGSLCRYEAFQPDDGLAHSWGQGRDATMRPSNGQRTKRVVSPSVTCFSFRGRSLKTQGWHAIRERSRSRYVLAATPPLAGRASGSIRSTVRSPLDQFEINKFQILADPVEFREPQIFSF
jgi:hypothetical protein